MILSGRDLQWYTETKKLKIEPVTCEQFQQNGIDLILDGIDSGNTRFTKLEFTLGTTREWLEMPDDLMAFVELRSTWARNGLILPPTIVDAGFKGNLTLEILPCLNMAVPIGQRFAHLIFAKLTSPSILYNGKYQGQIGITGPLADAAKVSK